MKVIEPTCRIIEEYFQEGRLLQQIERCGRVCYKSEDKITATSANAFIKGIVERGHFSVTEMGQIVLDVSIDSEAVLQKLFETIPRFITADRLEKKHFLLSGNPRAFRELILNHAPLKISKAVLKLLSAAYPVLYADLLPKHGLVEPDGVAVRMLSAQEIDALPVYLKKRHRTVLAHLTVNRAVTHELVRHRVASYLQESQRYCRYDQERFGGEVVFIKPCFYEEDSPEYKLWQKAMEETERIYIELLKTSSPQAARTVLPNSCKTEIMVHATLEEWGHIFRLRTSKWADPSMQEIMLKLKKQMVERFPDIFSHEN